MRVFRQPFWKANIAPVMYLMIFPACLTQYFYLTFTDDKLLIKNSVYTFWHREYKYSDITRISLSGGGGYSRPYIKVFTKNNPKLRLELRHRTRANKRLPRPARTYEIKRSPSGDRPTFRLPREQKFHPVLIKFIPKFYKEFLIREI